MNKGTMLACATGYAVRCMAETQIRGFKGQKARSIAKKHILNAASMYQVSPRAILACLRGIQQTIG